MNKGAQDQNWRGDRQATEHAEHFRRFIDPFISSSLLKRTGSAICEELFR